jgi:integrase
LRDYAIFLVMISAGLRTIEVARANVEDFQPIGDSMRLFIKGKGKDEKTDVEIAEPVEKAIRTYLKAMGNPSNGPLFRSTARRNTGERMTTRSISDIVKARLRNAGLDDEHPTAHSLRHTCSTQSRLNGVSLEETQKYYAIAK